MTDSKDVTEKEVDALFQKYSIEEIRNIEKKTRYDIEKKKEDLRQMVGARYRDLIEAADTITQMKTSAENVLATISNVQGLSQSMKQSFFKPSALKEKTKTRKAPLLQYSLAAQIKMLLDMAERIWSALDRADCLQAARLFLLARHIHTGLQTQPEHSALVHTWFPVLTRQWATLSHFHTTILQTCREKLRSESNDEVVAVCLGAIMLLENSSPRQVFSELLLARSAAMQNCFQNDAATVEEQTCTIVRIFIDTVHQIYTLFYNSEPVSTNATCGVLTQTLTSPVHTQPAVNLMQETSISRKYLPQNVLEFCPVVQHASQNIDEKTLQHHSQEWINSCCKMAVDGLSQLLKYVSSIKTLTGVRDEVWQVLKQDEKMQSWDQVCSKILQKHFNLWENLLQDLFMNRAKGILKTHFHAALDVCRTQLSKVLAELQSTTNTSLPDLDLSSYIWSESAQDLAPQSAWIPLEQRSLQDSGGLAMKARAYTPLIQSLCNLLDSKLDNTLQDSKHLSSQQPPPGGSTGSAKTSVAIETYVHNASIECVNGLLKLIEDNQEACRDQLMSSSDQEYRAIIISRLLTLARFAIAVTELCPHLQMTLTSAASPPQPSSRATRKAPGQTIAEDPKWTQVKEKFIKLAHDSYNLWIDCSLSNLIHHFEQEVTVDSWSGQLQTTTRWDEVDIVEEAEGGQKVKSAIRVPMQPSWNLQELFFAACKEVNRIGGHALHRSVSTQLMSMMATRVSNVFQASVKSETKTGLSQTRSLQLWFDAKWLSNMLPKQVSKSQPAPWQKHLLEVCHSLEDHIDPFDLDVFMPHMMSHLERHLHREQVLYGLILSNETPLTRAPTSTGQEQHNVLMLSSTQNRLALLPLSTGAGVGLVEPPKPKGMTRATEDLPNATKPSSDSSLPNSGSASLLSSLWFANK